MKLLVSDSSSVHHQEFIHCTLSNGMSYSFVDSFRAGSGWSCSKVVYKPVWHVPLLSVQWINSWWWTDELSETCRFSWQNKFIKLVHIVGFITKKFVTMRGHMNVKFDICYFMPYFLQYVAVQTESSSERSQFSSEVKHPKLYLPMHSSMSCTSYIISNGSCYIFIIIYKQIILQTNGMQKLPLS